MWKQKLPIGEQDIPHARELSACRKAIQRIKQSLELFEQKHRKSTAAFLEELRSGSLRYDPDLREDYDAWKSTCDSLEQWQELEIKLREIPANPDRKRE